MSDFVVLDICIQTQKQLAMLNNFWAPLKSVLIDNFVHAKSFLRARCMHAHCHVRNLSSPDCPSLTSI